MAAYKKHSPAFPIGKCLIISMSEKIYTERTHVVSNHFLKNHGKIKLEIPVLKEFFLLLLIYLKLTIKKFTSSKFITIVIKLVNVN